MLKISCRLSRFLTKWSFCAKVFPAPGSKNVLSYYSYRTRFLKQKLFCFYCECKQENKFDHGEKNWKDQQKPREEQQKPLEKSKVNSSLEAEEKITLQKRT